MTDIKQYEPLWGSWYVDEQLGEGSFGKVYKVHKEEFGKNYDAAVKIISIPQSEADILQAKSEGLNDESARSYFQAFVSDIIQEIDFMSEFRGNSNIVSLEDHKVIEKNDRIGWDILIRMELLTTLSAHITKKPLSQADVVKLGIDICHALELCSMKHAIHRDIKPDNIFISPYGDYKLGDFGIARQIERTMSGLSKKGTYTYMAPEVFKGMEYGSSVDMYSLGIVMYRFLNKNRTPFLPDFPNPITPHDRDEALQKRMSGELLPQIKDIDSELNNIVLKACAYERNDRFKNISEMKIALESLKGFEIPSSFTIQTKTQESDNEAEINEHTAEIKDDKLCEKTPIIISNDFEADNTEKTRGIFSINKNEHTVKIQDSNNDKFSVPDETVNFIAKIGGFCSIILAALSFFSGDSSRTITFFSLYALCSTQCLCKFKNKIFNAIFIFFLVAYNIFSISVNFYLYDYSFLILALSLISSTIVGINEKMYRISLYSVILTFALGIFILLSRVSTATHYAYVFGMAGVPVLMLLTLPTSLLLASKTETGFSLLATLHFFPLITYIIYILFARLYSNESFLFYIVNANFINISPENFSWWHYGRFLGVLIQATNIFVLSMMNIMVTLPEKFLYFYKKESRKKIFFMTLIFVFLLAIGLVILNLM